MNARQNAHELLDRLTAEQAAKVERWILDVWNPLPAPAPSPTMWDCHVQLDAGERYLVEGYSPEEAALRAKQQFLKEHSSSDDVMCDVELATPDTIETCQQNGTATMLRYQP